MEMAIRKSKDYTILDLKGSMDIYTATEFKSFITDNIKEYGVKLIVNMDELNYIDSSGIGVLIRSMNHMKELNGQFQIACVKEGLEKIFKVAGLTAYFKFIPEKEFKEKFITQ